MSFHTTELSMNSSDPNTRFAIGWQQVFRGIYIIYIIYNVVYLIQCLHNVFYSWLGMYVVPNTPVTSTTSRCADAVDATCRCNKVSYCGLFTSSFRQTESLIRRQKKHARECSYRGCLVNIISRPGTTDVLNEWAWAWRLLELVIMALPRGR